MAVTIGEVHHRFDPGVHHVVEEALGAGAAVQRLGVQLEEQPLVGPQRRVGQATPHGAHGVGAVEGGVLQEVGEEGALGLLHMLHDGDEEALAGAEVVDEHAVAGANGGGNFAEAEVTDAVLLNVIDDQSEKLLVTSLFGSRKSADLLPRAPRPGPRILRPYHSVAPTSTGWTL